jgi:hypothetical protein
VELTYNIKTEDIQEIVWHPADDISSKFKINNYYIRDDFADQLVISFTSNLEDVNVVGVVDITYRRETGTPSFVITEEGSVYATRGKIGMWQIEEDGSFRSTRNSNGHNYITGIR